ncbi:glycosyltransferase family 2 protein [Brevibacillus choshinensis]|uniref:glycosyltransferase family 2 protein n=1 Tax=Brevibacillus choshinensis TaxID=54911 RepID=UPI002E1C824C|nr:glycosyltransferase family 2 protein [Brevibacillus choshinensis]
MDHQGLPLVSVITPSFNQGRFIKETIESVLGQDYPNIEHIVVDGGSTDVTISILQQYSHFGDRFRYVSEKDRGQSHAINKGLSMARGDIIGWLNSDDTYQPGAIRKAVQALQSRPDCGMAHGKCYVINEHSQVQTALHVTPADYNNLYHGCVVCQPAAFIRKNVFQQMGGVDEALNFCMDYDLWIRIAQSHPIAYVNDFLANARVYSTTKTATQWHTVGISEVLLTVEKHYGSVSPTWLRHAPHYRKKPVQASPSVNANRTDIPATFGHPDKISSMNRYGDLWAPPLFRITVQTDPSITTLLVKGKAQSTHPGHPLHFPCNVLVNGAAVGTFMASSPFFVWDIPLDSGRPVNQVDILASKFMKDPSGSNRMISYIAENVMPLTAAETAFFKRSQNFFKR